MTMSKRDAAYDAVVDALQDDQLQLDAAMRAELERARTALENLTRFLTR